MNLSRAIILAIVTTALALRAVAADTVTLRPSASIANGTPVRIGDIADVQGEQSAAIHDVVVLGATMSGTRTNCAKSTIITINDVRRALAATKSINMGRVALNGSDVEVTIGDSRPADGTAVTTPQPVEGDTLKDALPAALARWLGVETVDIKIDTRAVDPKILATPLAQRTYAVSTATRGDVLPVQVRVYEGDRPVLTETIRVGVKIRRPACTATRDVKRGEVLTAADVRTEDAWVNAGVTPAEAGTAVGATVRTALKAGTVVEERQVDHPPTVRRGDLVSVDCIAGSVLLRITMRARQDGMSGEVIWLEPVSKGATARRLRSTAETSAESGPVRARVAGPGRAVTLATDEGTPGTGVAKEEATPEDPGRERSTGGSGSASAGIVDVRRLATGH